ncbi:MAG: cupin domain-containing protein [Gemmatimonadota bacterium]
MIRAGDALTNPVTGQTLRFVRTAADTGGALLEIESTWAPRGAEPPQHFHPQQAERFTVLDGALRVRVSGVERELHAGESLDIPVAVPHSMWNAGDVPAVARWETRPALGTERLFESLHAFAMAGAVNARGVPPLLDLAVLVPRHWNELRLTEPPPAVQRLVFGVLGPIARLLGKGRPPLNRGISS